MGLKYGEVYLSLVYRFDDSVGVEDRGTIIGKIDLQIEEVMAAKVQRLIQLADIEL